MINYFQSENTVLLGRSGKGRKPIINEFGPTNLYVKTYEET